MSCPSQLALERHSAGEKWSGSSEVAGHVAACAECDARLVEMARADEDFRQSAMAKSLQQRLSTDTCGTMQPWSGIRRYLWLPAAVVALCLILFVDNRSPDLVAKGDPVSFALSRGSEQARWDETSVLERGDVLQAVWAGGEYRYVLIVGRDPMGNVQTIYGADADRAQAIDSPEPRALGPSIRVDASTAGHELWILMAKTPFDLGPMREDLRRGAMPNFPGAMRRIPLHVRP